MRHTEPTKVEQPTPIGPTETCDDYLQECELCHDLFDIEQVSLQLTNQILCAKCAAGGGPKAIQPTQMTTDELNREWEHVYETRLGILTQGQADPRDHEMKIAADEANRHVARLKEQE